MDDIRIKQGLHELRYAPTQMFNETTYTQWNTGHTHTYKDSLSIHTYIHKGSLFMVGCVQHPTIHRESKIGDKLECSNYPFIHYIHVTLL